MAKLLFTLTALLFLISSSHSHTPSDLPDKETNGRDLSDTKTTTLLLPSEKPDSKPATVVEWEHAADSKLPDSDGMKKKSTEFKHSETVPLTVISFRPVNRHFPSRRPFPLSFRHGHRCRHGPRHVGPWTPRFHGGERDGVSYGDDMILSSGDDDLGFDPAFRGGARQIPSRLVNFRHGGPRFPFRHDDGVEEFKHHHGDQDQDRREWFEGMETDDHDHDRREGFEGMEKPREHRHKDHHDDHDHDRREWFEGMENPIKHRHDDHHDHHDDHHDDHDDHHDHHHDHDDHHEHHHDHHHDHHDDHHDHEDDHHDHRHDRREWFEGMEKPREHRHEHEGGLMRRFRKFLDHF